MIKRCLLAVTILIAFGSLGACGKKALLDVPEGATYPQPYPRP